MENKNNVSKAFNAYREDDKYITLVSDKAREIIDILEGKVDRCYTFTMDLIIKYFNINENEKHYQEIDNLLTNYFFNKEYRDNTFEDLEEDIKIIRGKA